MKTFHLKKNEVEKQKKWVIFNAEDQVLGRLASKIAVYLRGKHKPQYSPHLDCGDNVIVINAGKIAFKGSTDDKKYYRHTGYPGGIKSVTLTELLKTRPEKALEKAVKGMLGKTPLGRKQMKNLRVYTGDAHPHEAQKPEKIL